jgi:hypothetical protein
MKLKRLSLAIGLISTVMATNQLHATETVYENDSGLKIGIGLSSELIFRSIDNFDFNDDVDNGLQFPSPRPGTGDIFGSGTLSSMTGLNSDDRSGQILGEQRVWFDASKGNLELHTMLEWDGTLDSSVIDNNNPNLERARISYTLPEYGAKINAGADLFFATTIGRLVYVDDDPGLWINGKTRDGMTWQLAYHKRNENSGAAGDSESRDPFIGEGRDHDIFSGRLSFSGKTANQGNWYLEPFAVLQNRHDQEQNRTGGSQSTDMVAGFFGTGARYQEGALLIEGEVVTHQGKVDGTNLVSGRDGFNQDYDEMDINSYGAHLRVALNNIIAGKLSPYFSWDWASGDDDPTDDDLTGFVPVGTSTDLRADNLEWVRTSIVNQMPNAVGNNAVEFGFETMNLGIGPQLGGLTNNGFGANPGYHRLQLGVKGALAGKWGLSTRVVHLRFSETEAAVAGAQARGQNVNDVDEDIGWGYDLQFPYEAHENFSVTPFVSVFVPGDGAETLAEGDDTALMGGVKLLAIF